MANRHIRFQNALMFLREAREHFFEDEGNGIPGYEMDAKRELIDLCVEIATEAETNE